jgi:glyoxylate/hydroxypyruvate reductase A
MVEDDLIDALANGPIEAAVLDVVRTEPLPSNHPFWAHPKITITPHVSGWHADEGLIDVAENYKRLMNGQSLLNEVDRSKGY